MMLEVESLAFGYARRTVARDVGFSLGSGETMCVLGPNGSGKSTLFRTVLGLLPAHSGSVRLQGEPLERLSRAEIARRAAYVPQTHAARFAFTVREFVLMGRAARLGPFASPGAKDRAACERALEALGIEALGERAITELSGGERQLALVARALAQEPCVMVLDEPTAELDFGNQQRVLAMLARLASSGIAVLFSTHDPNHALAFAQRSLLLARGRALALGAPQDVVRPDLLEELYGVPVDVLRPENDTRGYAVRPRQRQETP